MHHRSRLVRGDAQGLAECLQFAADGKVRADIEPQPLSAINTVFERLEKGEVPSRVVLDLAVSADKSATNTDSHELVAEPA